MVVGGTGLGELEPMDKNNEVRFGMTATCVASKPIYLQCVVGSNEDMASDNLGPKVFEARYDEFVD